MSKCKVCGSDYTDGMQFCPTCGSKIIAVKISEQEENGQKSTAPTNNLPPNPPSSFKPSSENKEKAPFYKKKWFIVVVVLLILAAIGGGISGTKSESPSNSTASSGSPSAAATSSSSSSASSSAASKPAKKTLADTLSSAGVFEESTVTGSGDDVIDIPCAGMPCLIELEHDGGSNFTVWSVDANGNNVDLLVNEIGYYSGTVTTWSNYKKPTVLQIGADGNWSATFKPMKNVTIAQSGDSFSGANVVGIDTDKISKLSFSHNGKSNFIVQGVGTSSAKLLVNEIGNYDGTVVWSQNQSFFIVDADGDWTISW